jgi:hypothetical protein
LDRRLAEPQSRSGLGGEEINSQLLSVLEPPIIQPVVQRYTTELSRLIVFLAGVLSLYFVTEHLERLEGVLGEWR